MRLDFYKDFLLPAPVVGLVQKITSPKGIKKKESFGYSYHFHDDTAVLYHEEPSELEDGIYWVMDLYKEYDGQMIWNHYLFIIAGDTVKPVAEFLDQHDTVWVKSALTFVKGYYSGEELEEVELKGIKRPEKKSKKSPWDKYKK